MIYDKLYAGSTYPACIAGRNDYVAAFKGGFLAVDDSMNKESLGKDDSSGCTAVAVLIKGNKMFCVSFSDHFFLILLQDPCPVAIAGTCCCATCTKFKEVCDNVIKKVM